MHVSVFQQRHQTENQIERVDIGIAKKRLDKSQSLGRHFFIIRYQKVIHLFLKILILNIHLEKKTQNIYIPPPPPPLETCSRWPASSCWWCHVRQWCKFSLHCIETFVFIEVDQLCYIQYLVNLGLLVTPVYNPGL